MTDNQTDLDEDMLNAAVNLVDRAGARSFEVGYKNDEGTARYRRRGPEWYAHAEYKGTVIKVEGFDRPDLAAEALARKVLRGGRCRCGKLVALEEGGAMFVGGTMADGSKWSPPQAIRAGQCLWQRKGAKWEPSCDVPSVRVEGGRW